MNCPKLASGTMMGLLRQPVHLLTTRYAMVCSKASSHNSIIESTNNRNHRPVKPAIKDQDEVKRTNNLTYVNFRWCKLSKLDHWHSFLPISSPFTNKFDPIAAPPMRLWDVEKW